VQQQLQLLPLVRQPQLGWCAMQHQCCSLLLQRLLLVGLLKRPALHSWISSSWEEGTQMAGTAGRYLSLDRQQ
jgi:hypothetical protein